MTKALMSQREFVALNAMLFAVVALAIDSMLPALPQIAASLSPDAPNLAQLVITSFIFGMGVGTLISGPLSDSFGRKPVMLACAGLYILGAAVCFMAPTLETLLAARVLMGLGAAGPRAVGAALIRDMYKGSAMARIMSFVMMVFTLVPAVAPLMGQGVILVAGWRALFLVFMVFSLVVHTWFLLRQVETLPPEARRPLSLSKLAQAARELVTHRIALISTAAQALTAGALFANLSSMEGIFREYFDRAASFPLWFTVIAVCAMSGSAINARFVVRFGMRQMVRRAYGAQVVLTLATLGLFHFGLVSGNLAFALFLFWTISGFAAMGLTMGNLNAMAMESLGHIAGFASSLIAATSTVGSVLLAIPVGQAFDGTPLPLMIGSLVFSILAFGLSGLLRK
ncbi:multidrug effflux MFS transporter [Stagnihabitans tardus]|uniref:MFS transporter n=1 Tax=Stagnihabitans tardus TaxID=2699202 RepID=A0AAE5BUH3_9RHOB|nr:multidrug effflux MFS transporter [Stagnihabitans tardus]NBZ86103.1 MFS transporter [Stagnihabitans tardus]